MKTVDCFNNEDLCAWLRDEAPESQHKQIQKHIQSCPQCRETVSQFRQTLQFLESGPDLNVRHDLAPQILDQISAAEQKKRRRGFLIRAAAVLTLTVGLAGLFLSITNHTLPQQPQRGAQAPEKTTPVAVSLQWLASRQLDNGSWETDSGYKTAVTGLALISFLKADRTLREKHLPAMKKAVRFLQDSQSETGTYGYKDSCSAYNHALATAAMVNYCHRYPDPDIQTSVSNAVSCITRAQDPSGAWSGPGQSNQIPKCVWQTYALIEARDNGWTGLEKPINKSIAWLENMRRKQGRNIDAADRILGTRNPEKDSLIRFFLLADTRAGTDSSKHISGRDFSRYFFLTKALGKSTDRRAGKWIREIRENICRLQGIDGKWKPAHASENTGGPVYSTALATLCLL